MNSMKILKLTLKIKSAQKRIDVAVENNFGYCPQEQWFDDLVEQRNLDQKEINTLK